MNPLTPFEQLDRLVRDVATISGQIARIVERVEKLELRQAKAFGPDVTIGSGAKHDGTLHLPRKQA